MRFNLTGETYLPKLVSDFPEAPSMTLAEIVAASLFYSIVPLVLSFATYFIIYFAVKKLFKRTTTFSLLLTGFLLTLTTPLLYIFMEGYSPFRYEAEAWAWALCFLFSIGTYFCFNQKERQEFQSAM
jgi:hypothetical protein